MFTVVVEFWLSYCYSDLKSQIYDQQITFYGAFSARKNLTFAPVCFLQCDEICVIVECSNAISGGYNTRYIFY